MTKPTRPTLSREYFDGLYQSSADPWNFETSDYERGKYRETLQALPKPRYQSAFEIGCSIGVLTELLARRCERLLAADIAAEPLKVAVKRCAALEAVSFAQMQVPKDWPEGNFDLILLSEVVYYLDEGDVARLAQLLTHSLHPFGDCMLVHWTEPTEYPLSGDAAADLFIAATSGKLALVQQLRFDSYRIDVLTRAN
ncbi:MAG: SAM-dependent methyltransferase [Hyphomicrobiales bacterium]|nr:SAM-dependent methyltransferase [Hyphomicrobiales bacterium]